MGERLFVQVLGSTMAQVDGRPVDLGGPRQRRLLTALAVDAGRPVPWDRLADRVWDEGLPEDPRGTVRTYVHRLRQAMRSEASIITESGGFRLAVEAVELDCGRFQRLVLSAEDTGLDQHQRLARLDEALGLWRGEPFEDVSGELWVQPEADRLSELRMTAVERRYEAMLAVGMHTDALPGLARAADKYPLRDRLVGLRMLALFRSGRQAEAARVFQAHRDRLGEDVGLTPGPELVALDRRIVAGDPSLLAEATAGRPLRGYRLGERLGEGAFAVVYRGTQPSLGRDVAVKVIRPDLANRPEFIRRFETEAHVVARLEHPYIVPLYDYWREPDRACLVFRYLRGGTLESRLTSAGALTASQALAMVEQLGSALVEAHGAGIVHRDVKPANIFLDESDNFYLGDFGIALAAAELSDPAAVLSVGSPAYAPPEQLRREPLTPAADVFGLGISVYEALTGRLPFPSARTEAELLQHQLHDPIPPVREHRSDVTDRVDDVLATATAKSSAERYQSVEDLVVAFRAALDGDVEGLAGPSRSGTVTVVPGDEGRNPYKGLRAFTEADASDFYGRERLVDRLLELLNDTAEAGRVAAVVGPSGIGKSSVVRAGLLPALSQGAVEGSDRWFVATMLPGREPFEELAAALLRVAVRTPENLMGELTSDHRGIARVVKAMAPDEGDVLLVIDQFEELFTLVEDSTMTRRFLDGLEHAVTDARCPLRVVLTLRADFWDRPLRHGSFARLIDSSTVNVTALAPDELERAITVPAQRAGCEFEPGLVSEIVADVTDQPGALPLLQYALTELWERRVSGLLTRDVYRELGGVAGALSRRAEDLYDRADADEREAIRRVFGRLVTLGEGTEDTRRRTVRSELATGPFADLVLDRYGEARLLSFDTDPATSEPTVEVAHEALIRQWPRLREWLEDDRDGLRLQRHLTIAADEWHNQGRPESELYRGGRLETIETWATNHPNELTPIEDEFVTASINRRATEQDAQRRTNRRLRGLLVGVGVVAVIAMIAGALAFQQQGRAEDQAVLAEQRAREAQEQTELAQQSEAGAQAARVSADISRLGWQAAFQVESDRQVGLLLAVEAARRDLGLGGLSALQRVLVSQDWYLGTLGAGNAYQRAEWIDDETIIGYREGAIEIFNVPTARVTASLDQLVQLRPYRHADGQMTHRPLAAAGGGTVAFVTDAGETLKFLAVPALDEIGAVTVSDVDALTVAPDGSAVAVAFLDGHLRVYETSGDMRFEILAHPGETWADQETEPGVGRLFDEATEGFLFLRDTPTEVFFLGDGSELMTIRLYETRFWDTASGAPSRVLTTMQSDYSTGGNFASIAWGASLAPDESAVVTFSASWYSVNRLDGSPIGASQVDSANSAFGAPKVSRVLYRDDGTAWTLTNRGTLAIADMESGEVVGEPFETQTSGAEDLTLSPDGQRLAVAGSTGIVIVSASGDRLLAQAVPRGLTDAGGSSPDGGFVTRSSRGTGTGAFDTADVWAIDAATSIPLPAPNSANDRGPAPLVTPGTFNSWIATDGGALMSQARTEDPEINLITVWSEPGRERISFHVPLRWEGSAMTRQQDLWVYSDGVTREAVFVSLDDGTVLLRRQVFDDQTLRAMSFSADDTRLAVTGSEGGFRILAAPGWDVVESPLDDLDVSFVKFSPDGRWLITAEHEGLIRLRDADTYEVINDILVAQDTPSPGAIRFRGDLVEISVAGAPQLWDPVAGEAIGDPWPTDPGLAGSFTADTIPITVTGIGDNYLLWNLDTETWLDIACQAAGRNLTSEEWSQFGPADEPYRATCPQWPVSD